MADEKIIDEKELEQLKAENAELKAKIETLTKDIEKLKTAQSNASSEAAEYKRQYRATLDEASRKEAEMNDAQEEMRKQLEELKAEKRISYYKAKLMEAGYEADVAANMAANLPEGIGDDFFSQQKQFLEEQKAIAKKEALNSQPDLTKGQPPATAEDAANDKYRKWMGL